MNIEIFINNIIETIFLPPGMSIAMIATGLIIIKRFYASGKILLILGFSLLCILSLPVTAIQLNLLLEQDKVLTLSDLKKSKAQAIVVLGAGRYKNALEYEKQTDAISSNALTRLSYAAYLHKNSRIPLLLSGGSPGGELQSEASTMQRALKDIFQLQAKWLDKSSTNTWTSAKLSAEVLKKNNIKDIILVTHADHMPRSRMSFESFGLNVTAAPLGFKARNFREQGYTILHFLPSAHGISNSSSAIHEFIGYAWYLIRYKMSK